MSNELKAALWTALFTFLSLAIVALTGFLDAVVEFINGNDDTLSDDLSNLGKLLTSAVVAAVTGFVNWLVRFGQGKLGIGTTPTYEKPAPVEPS